MEKTPILIVNNGHGEGCGTPPAFVAPERGFWHGYYENIEGEQFILRWDFAAGKGRLYGGDIGWEEPSELVLTPEMKEMLKEFSLASDTGKNKVLQVILADPSIKRALGIIMGKLETHWFSCSFFTAIERQAMYYRANPEKAG